MTAATAITCSTQRAIHEGNRAGQRSKSPNASMALNPTNAVRPMTINMAVEEARPSTVPHPNDAISATRRRGHPQRGGALGRRGAAVTMQRTIEQLPARTARFCA